MKYTYSVIRFVPDPVRGEFINVGVIAGSDESSEWEMRTLENARRARCVDDRGLLHLVWTTFDDLGRKIDRYMESVQTNLFTTAEEALSEQWLTRLVDESRNVVQYAPPAIVLADSVTEALDIVFEQFVLEPVSRQYPFKKKNEALAAVRRAYKDIGLSRQSFTENASVMGSHHKERFDFVVGNGRALQLAQTWSFQIPNQDDLSEHIKAWAWTVKDVRDHGGSAVAGDRQIVVPYNVDIEAIYIAPRPNGPRQAMDEAMAAFAALDVHAVEFKNAHQVAQSASRLVSQATLPRATG